MHRIAVLASHVPSSPPIREWSSKIHDLRSIAEQRLAGCVGEHRANKHAGNAADELASVAGHAIAVPYKPRLFCVRVKAVKNGAQLRVNCCDFDQTIGHPTNVTGI